MNLVTYEGSVTSSRYFVCDNCDTKSMVGVRVAGDNIICEACLRRAIDLIDKYYEYNVAARSSMFNEWKVGK